MAGQTSAVTGPLHCSFAFDLAFEHITGMTGLTFLDLHPFRIGNLFAVLVFGVVTFGAFQSFLMRGMGKFDWFFSIGVNGYLGRSLVHFGGSQGDQTYAAEKCQCYTTDERLFHASLLLQKEK